MADDPRVQQLLDRLLDSDASPEEVCESWPELLPVVRHRWRQMHRIHAHLDVLFPASEDLSPWPLQEDAFPSIPGYEVEAILGRGGMGVVFKARHLRLNRTVAIKTLLGGGFAGPRERERFQREAETVAALRHPNIVQLYDVGEEEGRPYFTMEFVEGGSLALKLAGSPQPARPSADLVRTLADVVHAAHRGGIVHRDLKPGNVLLAADGTPKISDFGLARRLEGGAALTLSGVPVGTPSYMAPEQALGRAAAVGPATDVYALGAILYELLTGRPPFRAATGAETVQQVISQEPAPPSRLNAQVPRDLETICLKCLHKEPARRYSSAEELADDLRRFGEGRPIQARRVGLSERTWRWCRRNPTGAALTAALLVPIFMAVGGGLWLGRQSAERQGRAREAIEAVLTQVPGLRRQGRWPEAESILAQGRSRLVEAGSDDLRRRLVQAEKNLRLAAELERIRLTPSIEEHRFDYQGMAKAYAQAFALAGLDVQGDYDTVSARIRSSDLRPQLVMALDHWAYVADGLGDTTSRARLMGLARRADPDPRWGDRFRSPALWRDDEALRRLAAEVQAGLDRVGPENGPPTPLVALLAKKLGQKDGQAEPLLRAAQVRHPEDFWLNYGLGETLRERKPAEAVGFYRAALATRPTVASIHIEIIAALLRQGHANEAILACRRAVELEPKDGRFHFYLGQCLYDARRFTQALVEFRRSIEIDPKSAVFHHGTGLCLQAMGRIDEALGEFRRSKELDPKLLESHHHVAMCLQAMGRIDEAMSEFRRVIELNPKLAGPHHQLGICWQFGGQLDKAMDEYRRSIELDPKGAMSHYQLAACWRLKGRLDEAIAGYRHSIELNPRFGLGYEFLAETLLRSGRFTEARTALRLGLDMLPTEEPRIPSLRQKQELCERLIALDARLPALLQGEERPAAAELVELARLCREYGRPRAAAGLYAAAFAVQPSLADDLDAGHRYSAARAAARATAGLGPTGTRPSDRDRASLRRQALGWLRADLALAAKLRRDGKLADLPLADWQTENDLAGVRTPASLAELPAGEREEWSRLWADVNAALAADPLKRGRACASRRDWSQAADAYARAIKDGVPNDGHFWFEYAALTLLSGDRSDYARACSHMIEACGKDRGPRAYHVARACTLAPDSVADAPLPGRLAEKELRESAREFWSLTEQGALAYRQGRYQEAVSFFEQSLQSDSKPGRAVVNWIWLALAHQRVGNTEGARRWLDGAKTWLDQFGDGMPSNAEAEFALHYHNWLEAHVLLREADALIGQATLEGGDASRAAGTPSK